MAALVDLANDLPEVRLGHLHARQDRVALVIILPGGDGGAALVDRVEG